MAHGVPPSRLMLELRTQHNDFPHLAYDLIPPPPLFTLYPLYPRPEMCINPVGTLIKHGWSIYRRPKMSESHYSPYVTTPSGTRQTPTTVPHLLVPLHCTIPGALHLPTPTLPGSLHAAPHPHATCLPWCLQCHYPRSRKGSFGTLESQVPQGSIYPTGTRFHIPDFSLTSGSPGDQVSTPLTSPEALVFEKVPS